jgi:hypothetical protein
MLYDGLSDCVTFVRAYMWVGLGWLGELKFSVFFRVTARCIARQVVGETAPLYIMYFGL